MISLCSGATAQIQKGTDINGETAGDRSGHSVSMPDANTIAVGAELNSGNGSQAGHARVYQWIGNAWSQKGGDIDGEAANDNSGQAVSMPDANTIAIGAAQNDGNGGSAGHVRIYEWNGNAWIQKGGDIDGEASGDLSGYSVSMPDANTVAIGGFNNDGNGNNSGHARIFVWNGSAWIQKGSDINGEAADDNSGFSVSMPDANTVAIGAPLNDGNGTSAGHVRIFSWNGNAWIQKGGDINGEAAGDQSGYSVSMPDSNTVAIGAWLNDGNGTDAGHARIYAWNGSAWTQKGSDINGSATVDNAGWSISMPGPDVVAVGIPGNNGGGNDAGTVRIYNWNGSSWYQVGSDIYGEAAFDVSGYSVSMPNAYTVAIGARRNDGNGADAGHARVYSLCSNTSATISASACTSYVSPSGNFTWTTSGTYNDLIPNASGCDSLITINLTIVNPVAPTGAATQTFCDNATVADLTATGTFIQWYPVSSGGSPLPGSTALLNGSTYYASQTVSGCESTSRFAVTVTINSVTDLTTSVVGLSITANNTLASYIWLDCNAGYAVIPGETAQTFTATSNGSYAVQLTQNGCVDTSSCVIIMSVDIKTEQENNAISLLTNYENGVFTIDLGRAENSALISISDVNGRIVRSEIFNQKQFIDIAIDAPSGFYFLNVDTGKSKKVFKLIKY